MILVRWFDHSTALASVPGAGSTWTRILFEKASMLRTGSQYMDPSLKQMGLRLEGHKNYDVLMPDAGLPP